MKTSFFVVGLAVATLATAQSASADSSFWAINQFQTIEKLNGDTGAVVDSFAVPFLSGRAASIAVINNIGYYTILGQADIQTVNLTTHAYGGVAFTINPDNYTNGITTDAAGHLWFAGGNNSALREYTTAGVLLSTHDFPTAAGSFRDGSVVYGGMVVANRGDQQGPYDQYTIPGGNGALVLSKSAFINPAINGQHVFGSNGIAFNGTNFYTSDEQAHRVSKWDAAGNFVSFAALDPSSRYENWTFASQEIKGGGGVGAVPEPGMWSLLISGFGLVGASLRRRRIAIV